MKTRHELWIIALIVGFLVGLGYSWHKHPTLTLFCKNKIIHDIVEADAPLSLGEAGFVEYQKYEADDPFFISWEPPKQYQANCSAFLYE